MKCPKCNSETLKQFNIEGVAVDRCSACDGVWFDAEELGKILSEEARKLASLRRGSTHEELEGKKGSCPRDATVLLRVFSAVNKSVIIDVCPECHGVWLDGGEFEKLFSTRQQ
jgi:Zn-finger nucleic acid-binding protein